MKTKIKAILFVCAVMAIVTISGCGNTSGEAAPKAAASPAVPASELADGVYNADFTTDSSMFRVNEANSGKGVLAVKGGKMTIHVSLVSENIVNLFAGTAEDAQKDGAALLEPSTDTVTYSDGITEEVYGFDIPVPALDKEFAVAIIGTKGKWYDHRVKVSHPVPAGTSAQLPEDGQYTAEVTLSGGSGRATVESPAKLTVADGKVMATIVWSSKSYDYMMVDGTQYNPVNTEGNSTFEIPVTLDAEVAVSADTTAMGQPHLIEYTLRFDSATMKK